MQLGGFLWRVKRYVKNNKYYVAVSYRESPYSFFKYGGSVRWSSKTSITKARVDDKIKDILKKLIPAKQCYIIMLKDVYDKENSQHNFDFELTYSIMALDPESAEKIGWEIWDKFLAEVVPLGYSFLMAGDIEQGIGSGEQPIKALLRNRQQPRLEQAIDSILRSEGLKCK